MQNDEIFDVVDQFGKTIGTAKRSEVHGNPHLIHRSVHCLVFNSNGDIYLQKRSPKKDIQPGKWDTSVGGHLAPKETIQTAIKRETQEELSINIPIEQFTHLYQYILSNEIETELVDTFKITYDGPLTPHPDEISEGRFWSHKEITQNLDKNIFTPNFIEEWKKWNGV